ncbi:MAG: hypothetical protein ACOYMN_11425, partial [Roseimicrobium sp.]
MNDLQGVTSPALVGVGMSAEWLQMGVSHRRRNNHLADPRRQKMRNRCKSRSTKVATPVHMFVREISHISHHL